MLSKVVPNLLNTKQFFFLNCMWCCMKINSSFYALLTVLSACQQY